LRFWRKVKAGALSNPFATRDIRRKEWSGLTDKARIEAGLERLGQPCQSPAVKGKARCRMRGGGKSKQGKGSGAPKDNTNAYKHGARSAETRRIMAMMREMSRPIKGV
jgi:uncharacterized protein YjcR